MVALMAKRKRIDRPKTDGEFGRRLAAERKRRKLTRGALAVAADLTVSAITAIEEGAYDPRLIVAKRLAAALRLPLDKLAGPLPADVPEPVNPPLGRPPE